MHTTLLYKTHTGGEEQLFNVQLDKDRQYTPCMYNVLQDDAYAASVKKVWLTNWELNG